MKSQAIIDLDSALEASGERAILRRYVGTEDPDAVDVEVRALARQAGAPAEMMNGFQTDTRRVVISPSPLRGAGWPSVECSGDPMITPDPTMPRRGDRLVLQGREYRIEAVDALSENDEIVRIELYIKGGGSSG